MNDSKKFRKIIREEVQRQFILKELFEKTFDYKIERGSYPTEPDLPYGGEVIYSFESPGGFNYKVIVKIAIPKEKGKSSLKVDFKTEERGNKVTGEGVASQIIGTVVEIVREALNKLPEIDQLNLELQAAGENDPVEARSRLYITAIRSFLPNARIVDFRTNVIFKGIYIDIELPEGYKEDI